MRIFSKI